jgi:hypothetical protein
MRAKIIIIAMSLVLTSMGFFSANNVFAAEQNYTCSIDQIGGLTAKGGSMYVKLTDNASKKAFKGLLFRIPEGRLNQIMAVLLTAASTGSTVNIRADIAIKEPNKRLLKFVYYNP